MINDAAIAMIGNIERRKNILLSRYWECYQFALIGKIFRDSPSGLEQYQERLRGIERRYAIVMARRAGLPSPSWSYGNQLTNCQFDYNGQVKKYSIYGEDITK